MTEMSHPNLSVLAEVVSSDPTSELAFFAYRRKMMKEKCGREPTFFHQEANKNNTLKQFWRSGLEGLQLLAKKKYMAPYVLAQIVLLRGDNKWMTNVFASQSEISLRRKRWLLVESVRLVVEKQWMCERAW